MGCLNALTHTNHSASFKHVLVAGQRAVPHTNPCLYCSFSTKLLEDVDYASLFLSNFPITMPEPKAARWNARLKAKMVEEKDQIKLEKKEQCAEDSLLCREFAARSTRETSNGEQTFPWRNTVLFVVLPVIHEEYLCFVLGHLPCVGKMQNELARRTGVGG